MPSMDRFTWIPDTTSMVAPLHMVCPNCDNDWLGYVVHEDTCPTPKWVYDSRVDKCVVSHTCKG